MNPERLESLGSMPVPGDSPAGRNARYSPEMEALVAEMEKGSSLTASGVVDWQIVEQAASGILAEQSKDLLAATYLAISLMQQSGIDGFVDGVGLLRSMTENFWDGLYPELKRMRGRAQAIQWWADKSIAWLQEHPPAGLTQELVDTLNGQLGALDSFLAASMTEPPSLFELQSMVRMFPVKVAVPEQGAGPVPAAQPDLPSPSPAASRQGEAVAFTSDAFVDEDDARRTLRNALSAIGRVADFLMEKEPYSPEAFRLSRVAAWGRVDGLPPSEDGRTLLPPPPGELARALEELNENGSWAQLLRSAEEQVGIYLFWMDLACHSATALERLGRKEACTAVEQLTRSYAERIRGIEQLSFSDGTPFASATTLLWLKKLSKDIAGGGTEAMPAAGSDPLGMGIAADLSKAGEALKNGTLAEAVALLEKGMNSTVSGRESLLRRAAVVTFLLDARKPQQALPHLDRIVRDIERFSLESWDPGEAVRLLAAVHAGYRAQKDDTSKEKALAVASRISELSPSGALALEP